MMQFNRFQGGDSQAIEVDVDQYAMSQYLQRVYAWMMGGLAITALVAFGVYMTPEVFHVIHGTPLAFVVMLAPFGMVWYLGSRIDKMQPTTAAGMFIAFAALMGAGLAYVFQRYELDVT